MFTKTERSSFKYWFAHWNAFQMTALNHRMWKPKYLFHDIEKPWLRLFLPYEKVQKWHRKHHKHHPEWLEDKLRKCVDENIKKVLDRFDYEAMMIDWECSRFTKEASPLTAREELSKFCTLEHLHNYPNLLGRWQDEFEGRCKNVLDKYEFR